MARRIGIVGAGIGGLATALRLAHEGHEVEVFERLDHPGGRNARLQVGSVDFDAGPTLVMMLDPFRRELTRGQRWHFVMGWMPWIGDALGLAMTVLKGVVIWQG